jgi:hypothetical protein
MSTDLHPTVVRVYGYGVAWVPTGHTTWTMDLDEDYLNLPAHYATLAEAADRVCFLQERGFRARTVAVLAMPDDTAASIGDVTPQPPGQG